jgi:hypothetical protein
MHQVVGNSLRAMSTMNPPQGVDSAIRMVDTALANCVFAVLWIRSISRISSIQ